MAVRQYIGARYVTKIYENSLDPSSAEWEAGVSYEPLIVVTYLNSSYMSKKVVPGSVGDPASNPDYWTQTGFYNGQIAVLQNEIDEINSILYPGPRPFNSKSNVVMIGDSWSIGINAGGNTVGVGRWLSETLPSNSFIWDGEGSAGFKNIGSGGHTFVDLMENISVTDPSAITHVLYMGGVNDSSYSYSDMVTALTDTLDRTRTRFANADIYVVYCNRPTTSFSDVQYIRAGMAMQGYEGATILDCHKSVSFDKWIDSMHVNADGYKQCAKYCATALMGGVPSIGNTSKSVSSSCSELGWTGSLTLTETDDSFVVTFPTVNVSSLNIVAATTNPLNFTIPSDVFIPNDGERHCLTGYIKFADQTNKLATPVDYLSNATQNIRLEIFSDVNINAVYLSGKKFSVTNY